MRVDANVQVKNEALLLDQVLPEWDSYPIDHFVFYDDGSFDGTADVIQSNLEKNRYTILSDSIHTKFHEARNRSAMLEHSRDNGADIVISITQMNCYPIHLLISGTGLCPKHLIIN